MSYPTKKGRLAKKHSKLNVARNALLIFMGLYILSMFLPKIGGYTSYPLAVLRCGKEPVAIQKGYMPDGTPINHTYNVPSWKFKYQDYVCTAQEARSLDDRAYPSTTPTKKSPEEVEQCLNTPTKNGLHPTRTACESNMRRTPDGFFIIDG